MAKVLHNSRPRIASAYPSAMRTPCTALRNLVSIRPVRYASGSGGDERRLRGESKTNAKDAYVIARQHGCAGIWR
jgi:hypothetical protein